MSSVGSEAHRYLVVCRNHMELENLDFDVALSKYVPEHLRDEVRARWEAGHTQTISPPVVITGERAADDWLSRWDTSTGQYWTSYRDFLLHSEGWSPANVDALHTSSDSVLGHLGSPLEDGPDQFDVRGLVMGRVQSGKTANYLAVIAKAADAGYRLVIVLSGIHNSLRSQTQKRVNKALGIDPSGAEAPSGDEQWTALTLIDEKNGDFRPGSLGAKGMLSGSSKLVLVVKKNNSVLTRLIRWLGSAGPDLRIPTLVIDDEADQASVNTGGNRSLEEVSDLLAEDIDDAAAELDPSAINMSIRDLLCLFGRVSYVAYTATPFANVLIQYDAVDREVADDLYPRDFIVALPKPAGYVGAQELFGRDELPDDEDAHEGLDVIELVPEHEAAWLTPARSEVESWEARVPASLHTAIRDFMIASAAYRLRMGRVMPTTMLVHTHHMQDVQDALAEEVRIEVKRLRGDWRHDRDNAVASWQSRWDNRFNSVTASMDASRLRAFDTVADVMTDMLESGPQVRVLNQRSADALDYDDPHTHVIAIGGNRLSRGLTLEGLLVSYYVRRTMCFDTLMQMGRWFGFRSEYVDLTRIFVTEELSQWFRDISLAEEELALDLRQYERDKVTPLDVGPKIRAHPIMKITSDAKMQSAREVSQNLSGRLISLTTYPLRDRGALEVNLQAAHQLIESLGAPDDQDETDVQPVWSQVPAAKVLEFVGQYRTEPSGVYDSRVIRDFIEAMVAEGELTHWWVSVRGLSSRDELLGDEPLLSSRCAPPVSCISRSRLKASPLQIKALITPAGLNKAPDVGDDLVGLTPSQIRKARKSAERGERLAKALLKQRDPREGLMLLYPISKHSMPSPRSTTRVSLFDDPERDGVTVVGLAIAFPESNSPTTVTYVTGR